MQRFLNAVTALSMALYVVPPFAPLPAMAEGTTTETTAPADTAVPLVLPEGAFTIDLDGKTVICLPDKITVCPEGEFCVIAKVKAGCEKKATAKIAAQAAAEAAAPGTEVTVPADGNAATTEAPAAGTDAAASTEAVTPEPTPPPAPADQATAEQTAPATSETTIPAPAEAPALAETVAPAETTAPAETAAPAETTVPAPAPADATTADAATAGTTADTTADTTAPAADAGTAPTADSTAPADASATKTIKLRGKTVICLPLDKSVTCPEGSICVRPKSMDRCEIAAKTKLDLLASSAAEDKAAMKAAKAASDAAAKAAEAAGQPLVDAPKPTEEAVKSLDTVIAAPAADAGAEAVPEAPTAAAAATETASSDGKTPSETAPSPDAVVTEEKVTAEDTRSSAQEFAAAPATTADGAKKTGLSDLERAGLVALGALVIGQMLYGNNGGGSEVVSNSGDRVVVKDQSGAYQVYKDDDVLLRQPGANVRTETFTDGSTRTTVMRDDGTSVVTIRDASGRVLRRSAYDARGIETPLIDDTIPEIRVDVTKLPPPATTAGQTAANGKAYAHQFSLRQVRTIPEVKALAPLIKVDNVRFATGSAAIRPDQAQNLADLAKAMRAMIKRNPGKVFLIEGHTDAVGGAPMNLVLSDRRAESVAKALTEYYGVPPENMVVQGYGESELLIDSAGPELANRRVAVRDITVLLRQTKAK